MVAEPWLSKAGSVCAVAVVGVTFVLVVVAGKLWVADVDIEFVSVVGLV